MTWNDPHPTSKSQPRKPAPPCPDRNRHESQRLPYAVTTLIPTGPTPTPTGCKQNISDFFFPNVGPNVRRHRLRSRYVSFCSFFASSNHYLGSEVLLMTRVSAKRTSLTNIRTTHWHLLPSNGMWLLPISSPSNRMWRFLFSALGRRGLVDNGEDEHQNTTRNGPNTPRRRWQEHPQ